MSTPSALPQRGGNSGGVNRSGSDGQSPGASDDSVQKVREHVHQHEHKHKHSHAHKFVHSFNFDGLKDVLSMGLEVVNSIKLPRSVTINISPRQDTGSVAPRPLGKVDFYGRIFDGHHLEIDLSKDEEEIRGDVRAALKELGASDREARGRPSSFVLTSTTSVPAVAATVQRSQAEPTDEKQDSATVDVLEQKLRAAFAEVESLIAERKRGLDHLGGHIAAVKEALQTVRASNQKFTKAEEELKALHTRVGALHTKVGALEDTVRKQEAQINKIAAKKPNSVEIKRSHAALLQTLTCFLGTAAVLVLSWQLWSLWMDSSRHQREPVQFRFMGFGRGFEPDLPSRFGWFILVLGLVYFAWACYGELQSIYEGVDVQPIEHWWSAGIAGSVGGAFLAVLLWLVNRKIEKARTLA